MRVQREVDKAQSSEGGHGFRYECVCGGGHLDEHREGRGDVSQGACGLTSAHCSPPRTMMKRRVQKAVTVG